MNLDEEQLRMMKAKKDEIRKQNKIKETEVVNEGPKMEEQT